MYVTGNREAVIPTRLVLNLDSFKLKEAEHFTASLGRDSSGGAGQSGGKDPEG